LGLVVPVCVGPRRDRCEKQSRTSSNDPLIAAVMVVRGLGTPMSGHEPAAVAVVQGRTELFLAEVRECVESLPSIVDSYRTDPAVFSERVAGLAAQESVCNEAARELRVAVGESAAADAFFYPAGQFLSLVAALDGVANRAERVATELATIEPALSARCREALRRMAETAIRAFDALAAATTAYVEALATGGDTDAGVDSIERVRELESECDDTRRAALRMAFDDAPTAEALALRAVLHEADAVVDGMETVADSLDAMRATWL
jgi:uncharacterized protein Yka (UPF0111/DUF47 family)